MKPHKRPIIWDSDPMIPGFGLAILKREGDISDPDEYTWECDCEKCQTRYTNWKAKFLEQQKQHASNG